MATSANIQIFDENSNCIANIYKHYDGDIAKKILCDFIKGKKLVNGIPLDDSFCFNGMGDFAAQYIAYIKRDVGDVYLLPVQNENTMMDYNIKVFEKDGKIVVEETDAWNEN